MEVVKKKVKEKHIYIIDKAYNKIQENSIRKYKRPLFHEEKWDVT